MTDHNRRGFMALAAGTALLAGSGASHAQGYPTSLP